MTKRVKETAKRIKSGSVRMVRARGIEPALKLGKLTYTDILRPLNMADFASHSLLKQVKSYLLVCQSYPTSIDLYCGFK